jgi:hypothetical protein
MTSLAASIRSCQPLFARLRAKFVLVNLSIWARSARLGSDPSRAGRVKIFLAKLFHRGTSFPRMAGDKPRFPAIFGTLPDRWINILITDRFSAKRLTMA